MTALPLKDRLKAQIAASGPISVAEYMASCLSDPTDGYYATKEPFGADGDFITAPEVSQMFGELIAACLIGAYDAAGRPDHFVLTELGPGRGTLMADLLRTAKLRPDFLSAAKLCLVETSSRLREIQLDKLKGAPLAPDFLKSITELPAAPVLLVANEFFDALPIHQFVKTENGWRERMVGLDAQEALAFGIGSAVLPEHQIPVSAAMAPTGSILETQPAGNAVAEEIGLRLKTYGGLALIIDYGYLQTVPGETLQALYRQKPDPVLAHPGHADVTAHVNFEALAAAAQSAGARSLPPMTQGDFLLKMGLLERAGRLGTGKSHQEQESIRDAVERLAAPNQMGDLFKVLALTGGQGRLHPFDSSSHMGSGSR
ncbi:SAM-dependent MidA family methyltransferase [Roseibium hamelinense]|uniref:SAM-dependent MidA family methyltransferase n=1 Tax=Roseibium hamelinense TaxID=150831 RepID=A0A562SZJ5_9HYPH|nr:SAM-dependent methyltransferase [Roseibium hamelinense]MTI43632.1 class I SAM-dependent methyltransferase [Roseibium hamelinense]TWI86150.1 SAM-dependent MidA family methyltransferase [Roseibium hamelinense]